MIKISELYSLSMLKYILEWAWNSIFHLIKLIRLQSHIFPVTHQYNTPPSLLNLHITSILNIEEFYVSEVWIIKKFNKAYKRTGNVNYRLSLWTDRRIKLDKRNCSRVRGIFTTNFSLVYYLEVNELNDIQVIVW